ncbi:replication protein [Testudinibacter sp. TR-2022]|uniref:replication protein n=1 Tax=Testudinibacter sp. TR-2022 TaxID=2585029 RepID=UPI001118402C|nr:replication protein [Testudinibacter sp. TR-2022]TNH04060.1 replication protein [Pasteurellaceae bacterium Phil31]TNH10155.1 replication protein [Testudinibacter sp. TR-2022]TNH13015.1 replication protein [Testudinibacter sp. TR-2022]
MKKKLKQRSSIKAAKVYQKQRCKKHRNNQPRFVKELAGKDFSYTQKLLLNRAYKHDFNRNQFLIALRKAKQQRLKIRSDRREVLAVLIPVLINFCDLSLNRTYLWEIKTDLATIAKECGQCYRYIDKNDNVRERYDTVNNAIKMLEDAELITVLREMDKTVGKQKAMRIWLNAEFFIMLGFTETQLRKIMLRYHKYQFINNKLDSLDEYHKQHIARLEASNVASMHNKYKLHTKLSNIRRRFLGDTIIQYVAQRKPIDYKDQVISTYPFVPCFKSEADCANDKEVELLRIRLLNKAMAREKAKQAAYYKALIKEAS